MSLIKISGKKNIVNRWAISMIMIRLQTTNNRPSFSTKKTDEFALPSNERIAFLFHPWLNEDEIRRIFHISQFKLSTKEWYEFHPVAPYPVHVKCMEAKRHEIGTALY